MSLSRQVLSSPFDVEQRPRETSTQTQKGGNRIKVKENGGSSLIARNSTTEDSACSVNQQPGSISFDSRLIKNDSPRHIFANPIVTVKEQPQQHNSKDESKSRQDAKKRKDSTPPPVKGRQHISIQTDDYNDTDTVVSDNNFQEKLNTFSMEKLSIDATTEVKREVVEETASCNDEPQKGNVPP